MRAAEKKSSQVTFAGSRATSSRWASAASTSFRIRRPSQPSQSFASSAILVASRVIGIFEGSIQRLVALAALMPIVAGIGGNSGNQTTTMIVRAAALGQVTREQSRQLIRKELTVALLNGLIWGGVMGIVAILLYRQVSLGLVMVVAMTLNLMLAALMGVLIPMTMMKLGRDPAVGSSVMITAVTDSGGFFIFLGLATLFLV